MACLRTNLATSPTDAPVGRESIYWCTGVDKLAGSWQDNNNKRVIGETSRTHLLRAFMMAARPLRRRCLRFKAPRDELTALGSLTFSRLDTTATTGRAAAIGFYRAGRYSPRYSETGNRFDSGAARSQRHRSTDKPPYDKTSSTMLNIGWHLTVLTET